MEKSKSLVVPKKGILKKVQDFFRKLFKKQNNIPVEIEEVQIENTTKQDKIKEKFVNDLKKNTNNDIKELIYKIQNGELNLGEKDEAELTQIEEQLNKYLVYLNQEIDTKKTKIDSLRISISNLN